MNIKAAFSQSKWLAWMTAGMVAWSLLIFNRKHKHLDVIWSFLLRVCACSYLCFIHSCGTTMTVWLLNGTWYNTISCVYMQCISFNLCRLSTTGALESNTEYEEKLKSKTKSEKDMFALAWKIEELKQFCSECRSLRTEINVVMDLVGNPASGSEQHVNIPCRLTVLRDRLCAVVKATYRYRRKPATHVFVFMISPEHRRQKPYAIPVQCVSCASLNEK